MLVALWTHESNDPGSSFCDFGKWPMRAQRALTEMSNIWRPSDIMAPVASGFFPRHVWGWSKGRGQEASGRAFQNPSFTPLSCYLIKKPHPTLPSPSSSSHLPHFLPFLLHAKCRWSFTAVGTDGIEQGGQISQSTQTLCGTTRRRNHRSLHWYFFPK